ncbi:MAG: DUF5107 domain-containing protein [Oligosphaeraceae bacterium]
MRIVCGKTSLEVGEHTILGNGDWRRSPLPPLRTFPPYRVVSQVPPSDGLWVGEGGISDVLPYTMVDDYHWSRTPSGFPSVTLENGHLQAVFLPTCGGRLWKLYDKDRGRDLFYENPAMRPSCLGICNAWAAGGGEFNFGVRGHDAYTLLPLFTDVLQDEDGTPVLRFYEFHRIRRLTFQRDIFLPEDSPFLFQRVRVVNPLEEANHFYYWANFAVRERQRQRIVVPADSTYVNYSLEDGVDSLTKAPLPVAGEFDVTIPMNHPIAEDNFFNLDSRERPYELCVEEDGTGVVLASTARLQGRKLFVWGMGNGGRHWQRHLLGPSGVTYVEIQAGICKTQAECMPMPPHAVWEWLEAYGGLSVTPQRIFGEWAEARQEARCRLDEALPQAFLEETLERTRRSFALRRGTRLFSGSGWGALENLRRRLAKEPALEEQLDFGEPQEEQAPWVSLLEGRGFPCPREDWLAPSYMVQEEFCQLLAQEEKSPRGRRNWLLLAHRGVQAFHEGDLPQAEKCFRRSLECQDSTLGHYGLACTLRRQGAQKECLEEAEKAVRRKPSCVSLVKEAFRIFREYGAWEPLLVLYEGALPQEVQNVPMVRFLYAFAMAGKGEWRRAESIIQEEKVRELPDIREGETTFTEIYLLIRQKEAEENNRPFDPKKLPIPPEYDFRPSARR